MFFLRCSLLLASPLLLHGFSMGCSPFRVVPALAWVLHGLQLPQSVLLCHGTPLSKSTFPATSPSMSPTTRLLYSFLFSKCVFLHTLHFSFCASSCLLFVVSFVCLLLCLLPLVAIALSKICLSKGSLCCSDWLRFWLIVVFIHFGDGWNQLWLAGDCSWHPLT